MTCRLHLSFGCLIFMKLFKMDVKDNIGAKHFVLQATLKQCVL